MRISMRMGWIVVSTLFHVFLAQHPISMIKIIREEMRLILIIAHS